MIRRVFAALLAVALLAPAAMSCAETGAAPACACCTLHTHKTRGAAVPVCCRFVPSAAVAPVVAPTAPVAIFLARSFAAPVARAERASAFAVRIQPQAPPGAVRGLSPPAFTA